MKYYKNLYTSAKESSDQYEYGWVHYFRYDDDHNDIHKIRLYGYDHWHRVWNKVVPQMTLYSYFNNGIKNGFIVEITESEAFVEIL